MCPQPAKFQKSNTEEKVVIDYDDDEEEEDFDEEVIKPDLEIIGLHAEAEGWNVRVGSVLRLVVSTCERNGIECHLVGTDGLDTCTVGFLSATHAKDVRDKQHINKFIIVSELYEETENPYKLLVSRVMGGMASASYLDETGRSE